MYAGIEGPARRILPNLEQYVADFPGGAAIDDDCGFSLRSVAGDHAPHRLSKRHDDLHNLPRLADETYAFTPYI
jgi:hypothetical protein